MRALVQDIFPLSELKAEQYITSLESFAAELANLHSRVYFSVGVKSCIISQIVGG